MATDRSWLVGLPRPFSSRLFKSLDERRISKTLGVVDDGLILHVNSVIFDICQECNEISLLGFGELLQKVEEMSRVVGCINGRRLLQRTGRVCLIVSVLAESHE